MTDRTQEEIRADLDRERKVYRAANDEICVLENELRQAKTRDATAKPHPWAGRSVVLPATGGWGRTRARRGVVVVHDGVYRTSKGMRPSAGEWYVRSNGGKGQFAYSILFDVDPETGKCGAWELDE